jgi:nitrogen regulatory protein PII
LRLAGKIGDGRIFVVKLTAAMRVRTRERNGDAL